MNENSKNPVSEMNQNEPNEAKRTKFFTHNQIFFNSQLKFFTYNQIFLTHN